MDNKAALIVGFDSETIEAIRSQLIDLGYGTENVSNLFNAAARVKAGEFALVVVELDLAALDHVNSCRNLRVDYPLLPIFALMKTSLDELHRALGDELLADDYLQLPFHPSEFRARVRALLRRADSLTNNNEQSEKLIFGELAIDDAAREVRLSGNLLELTPTEYDLLKLLVSSPGRVFSREDLLRLVWENELSNYEYNVTTHVSRLRNKLKGTPGYAQCIQTVRGVGYRFVREI